jgi:hypothetical protein
MWGTRMMQNKNDTIPLIYLLGAEVARVKAFVSSIPPNERHEILGVFGINKTEIAGVCVLNHILLNVLQNKKILFVSNPTINYANSSNIEFCLNFNYLDKSLNMHIFTLRVIPGFESFIVNLYLPKDQKNLLSPKEKDELLADLGGFFMIEIHKNKLMEAAAHFDANAGTSDQEIVDYYISQLPVKSSGDKVNWKFMLSNFHWFLHNKPNMSSRELINLANIFLYKSLSVEKDEVMLETQKFDKDPNYRIKDYLDFWANKLSIMGSFSIDVARNKLYTEIMTTFKSENFPSYRELNE